MFSKSSAIRAAHERSGSFVILKEFFQRAPIDAISNRCNPMVFTLQGENGGTACTVYGGEKLLFFTQPLFERGAVHTIYGLGDLLIGMRTRCRTPALMIRG